MNTATQLSIENRLNHEIAALNSGTLQEHETDAPQTNVSFSDFLADKMLIISVIRKGVPYSLFNAIREYAPFTENDWATLLDISTKSLNRHKQNSLHFRSFQSEKIIEISEVTNTGLEVFGSMKKLKLWLHTPNFSLGSLTPVELLKDSYGKELVLAELTRINHGILA